MHYEVIYGDTDSIMINTNITDYDEVFAVGKKVNTIFFHFTQFLFHTRQSYQFLYELTIFSDQTRDQQIVQKSRT